MQRTANTNSKLRSQIESLERSFFRGNMTGNDFITWVLRSPFHGMLSNGMMLITVTGRKTGKKYTMLRVSPNFPSAIRLPKIIAKITKR